MTPEFFHCDPRTEPSDALPVGAEFECVYAPEATTNDGWVIVRFKVGMFHSIHPKLAHQFLKGYAQIGKREISEEEAVETWRSINQ